MEISVVLQVFGHKSKKLTKCNSDLVMNLDEKLQAHQCR